MIFISNKFKLFFKKTNKITNSESIFTMYHKTIPFNYLILICLLILIFNH